MTANNNYVGVGRMGRDPEMTYTPEGKAVTKFSLAVDKYDFKAKERRPMWLNCICFNSLAERINTWGQKGAITAIVGELDISEYTDKDGNKRTWVSIVCSDVSMVSGFKTKNSYDSAPGRTTVTEEHNWQPVPGDERPF